MSQNASNQFFYGGIKLTKKNFDRELGDVKLGEMIRTENIRNKLLGAEEYFQKNKYFFALHAAWDGFDDSFKLFKESIVGKDRMFGLIPNQGEEIDKYKIRCEYERGIDKIRATLALLTLNLSVKEYVKFQRTASELDKILDEKNQNEFNNKEENLKKLEFVIFFAIEGIIKKEARMGDLEQMHSEFN